MAHTYESNPFLVIRAALSNLAELALYMETESEYGPENSCPDYVAHLRDTIRAICVAQTFEDLARIEWISGRAALGLDAACPS